MVQALSTLTQSCNSPPAGASKHSAPFLIGQTCASVTVFPRQRLSGFDLNGCSVMTG